MDADSGLGSHLDVQEHCSFHLAQKCGEVVADVAPQGAELRGKAGQSIQGGSAQAPPMP
ncbi:hypothetical protein D3C73_1337510 [compost metagenome]